MAAEVTRYPERPGRHPVGAWFWGGFVAVILVGVLLALFAALRSGQRWAEDGLARTEELPPAWKTVVRVTLSGGQSLLVDNETMPFVRAQSRDWLTLRRDGLAAEIRQAADQGARSALAAAEQRIPHFADWYYSLSGEYGRLLHAALGDLPEALAARMDELVFQPAGTAAAVDRLNTRLADDVDQGLRRGLADYEDWLIRIVHEHRVPDSALNLRIEGDWAPTGPVTEALDPLLTLSTGDIARQGVATSAGAAVSAVTLKKLGAATVAKSGAALAGEQAAGLGVALASKLGLKTAVKGGSALGGAGVAAASGAALCTGSLLGAPLAPGCALVGGLVAGVVTWLAVDKAVLEADELLNRESLEADLRVALDAQREALTATLDAHYQEVAGTVFARLAALSDPPPAPTATRQVPVFTPVQARPR